MSKRILSFAEGSVKYKLTECEGDSSMARTFNRFIYLFFSFFFLFKLVVVVAACY